MSCLALRTDNISRLLRLLQSKKAKAIKGQETYKQSLQREVRVYEQKTCTFQNIECHGMSSGHEICKFAQFLFLSIDLIISKKA